MDIPKKPIAKKQPIAHGLVFDDDVVEDSDELNDGIGNLPYGLQPAAEKLLKLIAEDGVTEILMNGPQEILFRKEGQRFFVDDISFPDAESYHRVINEVILPLAKVKGRIGETPYLIEGQLEMDDPYDAKNTLLARIHIVAPPATDTAKITIAKKARYQYIIDDIIDNGAMSYGMGAFLKACSRARVTIVFSGLSGSGKTTILEALSFEFDTNDRVIVVEETPELRLPLEDVVYLPAQSVTPGIDSEDTVTVEWLVAQANRMRPDRIIVGECRGGEAAEFISAANSGADGSMTTLHASSPRQALDKLLTFYMKSQDDRSEFAVLRDISSTVQLIVQTNLIDGKHIVTQIEEVSKIIRKDGVTIATTPIFEYNRFKEKFEAKNRPSEQLIEYMASRGVQVDLSWFQ